MKINALVLTGIVSVFLVESCQGDQMAQMFGTGRNRRLGEEGGELPKHFPVCAMTAYTLQLYFRNLPGNGQPQQNNYVTPLQKPFFRELP
jgi:hypothetical protein